MLPSYVRWGFIVFFASHLFATLLLDVQALPIGDSFPEALRGLIRVSYMGLHWGVSSLRCCLPMQHPCHRRLLVNHRATHIVSTVSTSYSQ